jgi:hypothetical protein
MPTENIDDLAIRDVLEQRADYIPVDEIVVETYSEGENFKNAIAELTNKALRTLVGPRGSGKTHLMRYTWAICKKDVAAPFAVYVSFNRYFRLEPMQTTKPNPDELFHSWTLSLILFSAYDAAVLWGIQETTIADIYNEFGVDRTTLQGLISRIERGQPLSNSESALSNLLSVSDTKALIDMLRVAAGRKFSILLLDDAALTLTPVFLVDFLDTVRALKSATIAPKASVYPGTTEYSPRFHAGQDALAVPVWHPIDSESYSAIMGGIAGKRVNNLDKIPDDVIELLKYAAFGIPRAFLSMVWEYQRRKARSTQQSVINSIIQEYLSSRLSEYRSLKKKVPKFQTIITAGEELLNEMGTSVKDANAKSIPNHEKQISIGILKDDISSIVKRMLDLLVEAGLIYEQTEVKHGLPARVYHRYVPHTAVLLGVRAFSIGQHGTSPKQIVEVMKYKSVKHPIRKKLSILSPANIATLKIDLPPCSRCNAPRLTESQRFCHACGSELIDSSSFTECCRVNIIDVPGLTSWQKQQMTSVLPKFKTIGDYIAKQDPSAELLTIRGIGTKRSTKIIDVLNGFIDEFLS